MSDTTKTSGDPYPTILRSYDRLEGVVVEFDEDEPKSQSRTKQSFAEETDVNHIMAKWKKTGTVDHVNMSQPMYTSYPIPQNYQDAVDLVVEAQEQFQNLDAGVRRRFNNDPQELLAFIADSDNQAEAVTLGLVDEVVIPGTQPAPAPADPVTPQGGETGAVAPPEGESK